MSVYDSGEYEVRGVLSRCLVMSSALYSSEAKTESAFIHTQREGERERDNSCIDGVNTDRLHDSFHVLSTWRRQTEHGSVLVCL